MDISFIKKILIRVAGLPSASLRRWKTKQLLPIIIIIFFCIINLPHIDFASDSEIKLPEQNPFMQQKKEYDSIFSSADFIIITIESKELFNKATLAAMERLTAQFEAMASLHSVVSIASISNLEVKDDRLVNAPLLSPGYDPAVIRDTITANPLFGQYLLSDDKKLFNIYLFPDPKAALDNDQFIEAIHKTTRQETGLTIKAWGKRVIEYNLKKTIVRDFLFLGSLSLLIILAIQLLFTRSLLPGFLLFLSSFLTTAMTLALFPLFNLPLKVTTIMIPVIILALSTSYNIHIARYYQLMEKPDIAAALEHASPVILFTGGSTILGFLTLLSSSIEILRQFGLILVIGIAFAVLMALFFLPPLISKVRFSGGKEKKVWSLPLLKKGTLFLLFTLLCAFLLFLIPGIGRISYDYRASALFMPHTALYRDILYLNNHYKGFDELELIIDSKQEYGLIDYGLYQSLRKVIEEISRRQEVSQVISFTHFTDWLHRKLALPGTDPEVNSAEGIGETLELLFSNETGLPVNMLIDMNYRYARILIRFGTEITRSSREAVGQYNALTENIQMLCEKELKGVSYTLMGSTVKDKYLVEQLKNGQLLSIALFMLVFGLILFLRFRSLKTTLLILLPGLSNVLFFTGIMGWLTIPLAVNTLLAIAIVMGVSTDDAVYFMVSYQTMRKQGKSDPLAGTLAVSAKAIVYTTLIIVLGISVLVLSDYQPIIQTSLLIIGSLVLANLITLFLVPGLISVMAETDKKTKIKKGVFL